MQKLCELLKWNLLHNQTISADDFHAQDHPRNQIKWRLLFDIFLMYHRGNAVDIDHKQRHLLRLRQIQIGS